MTDAGNTTKKVLPRREARKPVPDAAPKAGKPAEVESVDHAPKVADAAETAIRQIDASAWGVPSPSSAVAAAATPPERAALDATAVAAGRVATHAMAGVRRAAASAVPPRRRSDPPPSPRRATLLKEARTDPGGTSASTRPDAPSVLDDSSPGAPWPESPDDIFKNGIVHYINADKILSRQDEIDYKQVIDIEVGHYIIYRGSILARKLQEAGALDHAERMPNTGSLKLSEQDSEAINKLKEECSQRLTDHNNTIERAHQLIYYAIGDQDLIDIDKVLPVLFKGLNNNLARTIQYDRSKPLKTMELGHHVLIDQNGNYDSIKIENLVAAFEAGFTGNMPHNGENIVMGPGADKEQLLTALQQLGYTFVYDDYLNCYVVKSVPGEPAGTATSDSGLPPVPPPRPHVRKTILTTDELTALRSAIRDDDEPPTLPLDLDLPELWQTATTGPGEPVPGPFDARSETEPPLPRPDQIFENGIAHYINTGKILSPEEYIIVLENSRLQVGIIIEKDYAFIDRLQKAGVLAHAEDTNVQGTNDAFKLVEADRAAIEKFSKDNEKIAFAYLDEKDKARRFIYHAIGSFKKITRAQMRGLLAGLNNDQQNGIFKGIVSPMDIAGMVLIDADGLYDQVKLNAFKEAVRNREITLGYAVGQSLAISWDYQDTLEALGYEFEFDRKTRDLRVTKVPDSDDEPPTITLDAEDGDGDRVPEFTSPEGEYVVDFLDTFPDDFERSLQRRIKEITNQEVRDYLNDNWQVFAQLRSVLWTWDDISQESRKSYLQARQRWDWSKDRDNLIIKDNYFKHAIQREQYHIRELRDLLANLEKSFATLESAKKLIEQNLKPLVSDIIHNGRYYTDLASQSDSSEPPIEPLIAFSADDDPTLPADPTNLPSTDVVTTPGSPASTAPPEPAPAVETPLKSPDLSIRTQYWLTRLTDKLNQEDTFHSPDLSVKLEAQKDWLEINGWVGKTAEDRSTPLDRLANEIQKTGIAMELIYADFTASTKSDAEESGAERGETTLTQKITQLAEMYQLPEETVKEVLDQQQYQLELQAKRDVMDKHALRKGLIKGGKYMAASLALAFTGVGVSALLGGLTVVRVIDNLRHDKRTKKAMEDRLDAYQIALSPSSGSTLRKTWDANIAAALMQAKEEQIRKLVDPQPDIDSGREQIDDYFINQNFSNRWHRDSKGLSDDEIEAKRIEFAAELDRVLQEYKNPNWRNDIMSWAEKELLPEQQSMYHALKALHEVDKSHLAEINTQIAAKSRQDNNWLAKMTKPFKRFFPTELSERMASTAVFAVSGAVARSVPGLRRALGAVVGWKLGGIAGEYLVRKTGEKKTEAGKLIEYLNDDEAILDQKYFADIADYLSDNTFRETQPAVYAQLREAQDNFISRKITDSRTALDQITGFNTDLEKALGNRKFKKVEFLLTKYGLATLGALGGAALFDFLGSDTTKSLRELFLGEDALVRSGSLLDTGNLNEISGMLGSLGSDAGGDGAATSPEATSAPTPAGEPTPEPPIPGEVVEPAATSAPGAAPAPEAGSAAPEASTSPDEFVGPPSHEFTALIEKATVHKGEGIWHALKEQLSNKDTATKFGWDDHTNQQTWMTNKIAELLNQTNMTVDGNNVAVIDPVTGKQLWVMEPDKYAFVLGGTAEAPTITIYDTTTNQPLTGDQSAIDAALKQVPGQVRQAAEAIAPPSAEPVEIPRTIDRYGLYEPGMDYDTYRETFLNHHFGSEEAARATMEARSPANIESINSGLLDQYNQIQDYVTASTAGAGGGDIDGSSTEPSGIAPPPATFDDSRPGAGPSESSSSGDSGIGGATEVTSPETVSMFPELDLTKTHSDIINSIRDSLSRNSTIGWGTLQFHEDAGKVMISHVTNPTQRFEFTNELQDILKQRLGSDFSTTGANSIGVNEFNEFGARSQPVS